MMMMMFIEFPFLAWLVHRKGIRLIKPVQLSPNIFFQRRKKITVPNWPTQVYNNNNKWSK